jgi:ABC-type transporter Mla subunit MlaD
MVAKKYAAPSDPRLATRSNTVAAGDENQTTAGHTSSERVRSLEATVIHLQRHLAARDADCAALRVALDESHRVNSALLDQTAALQGALERALLVLGQTQALSATVHPSLPRQVKTQSSPPARAASDAASQRSCFADGAALDYTPRDAIGSGGDPPLASDCASSMDAMLHAIARLKAVVHAP